MSLIRAIMFEAEIITKEIEFSNEIWLNLITFGIIFLFINIFILSMRFLRYFLWYENFPILSDQKYKIIMWTKQKIQKVKILQRDDRSASLYTLGEIFNSNSLEIVTFSNVDRDRRLRHCMNLICLLSHLRTLKNLITIGDCTDVGWTVPLWVWQSLRAHPPS